MENKKKNRVGKTSKRAASQQQQDRDQSRTDDSSGGPPRNTGGALSKHPSSSSSTVPRSQDLNPSSQPQPSVPIQQDQRHREPPQQQFSQQGPSQEFRGPPPQHGNLQTRWGSPPGFQQAKGQRPSRPAFSSTGPQQPPPLSQTSPSQQGPTWGPKSASSELQLRSSQPEVASPHKPDQSVTKVRGSQRTPVAVRAPDPQSGPSQPQETASEESCTSKPVGKKKKKGKGRGTEDKPLEESLLAALVMGSSSKECDGKTKTKVGESGPRSTPIQEPAQAADKSLTIPKRQEGILKHSVEYFQSEEGNLVDVNFIRIDIENMNFNIYQYSVNIIPGRRKELYREAVNLLLGPNGINRNAAYDGGTLLFVPGNRLQFPDDTDSFTGSVEVSFDGHPINYTIEINFSKEINLQALREYMRNGSSEEPFNVQALDVAFMHAAANTALIKAGREFFVRPEQPTYLGNGMDLWTGHHQSVVIPWLDETEPHLYLNVDVAHKGFPRSQLVMDYIRHEFFNRTPPQSDSTLNDNQIETAKKFLNGVKVEYRVNDERRLFFKVQAIDQSAREARFRPGDNECEVTVEDYFKNSKNVILQYPNLPCLKDSRNRLFPMELCTVAPNQVVNKQLEGTQSRTMVRAAARPTYERKATITQSVTEANFANDPCLREFGLTLNTAFEKVNCYELKPPSIQYNRETAFVKNGVWNQIDDFINSKKLLKWVIINTDPGEISDDCVSKIIEKFEEVGSSCGVTVNKPFAVKKDLQEFDENEFASIFKKFKIKGAQFFMVILRGRDECIYSHVKRAAELQVGVLTQCMQSKTAKSAQQGNRFAMTVRHILLKLNAKINGVNHKLAALLKPDILDEDVMLVGADVTHPPPGSTELSIAAVAASHDKYGFQYNMEYRLQSAQLEIITDLRNMIIKQMKYYEEKTGNIPKRILYYRDGVAHSQFKQVLKTEVEAIKKVCSAFKPRIALTCIVVQKRHHTRFFPDRSLSDGSRNVNVRAGTLVDEKITHPTEINFYLVSHYSIQGTARPTKYHLLYDDSSPAIDQETLERLTYYLCHMFARCNRSVSYPAPTYYAHLAAFRAKAWWARAFRQHIDENNLRNIQNEGGRVLDDVVNKYPMFFI